MGSTFLRKIILSSALFFGVEKGLAQPFVDILNTSYQSVNTPYKVDTVLKKNKTSNFFLNLTVPVKVDSQNTIIVRLYGERLISQITDYTPNWYSDISSGSLYSFIMPVGLQHETKSKKWKYLGLAMPKVSGQLSPMGSIELQLGGYGLATWSRSNNFKVKFGLFYNREFFGNFFVPLFGIDWKVNPRLQMYGVLPTSYRIEYALWKQHFYVGLAFKSYTRSYHLRVDGLLGSNDYYVRNNEMQVKTFAEMYIAKRIVLFGEFGRTLNYSPTLYMWETKNKAPDPGVYSALRDAFFFNVGIAYRIRFDFI